MDSLKVGFIGYGKHARANLYPSIRQLGVDISAVATTHIESAQQASKDFNVPKYYVSNIDMLEKEELDCVLISAKPEQQVQLVKDALNAKVHVFVEKNLGFTKQEAEEIDAISKKTGKFVMVGFMKRFAPIYVKLKEIITNPEFGDVVSISQVFASRNFVNSSKEYILFAAIHFIDLIRFLVGEVVQATSFENEKDGSITISILLKSASGVIINISLCASPSWSGGVQEITVNGTKGYARTFGINNLRYHFTQETSQIPSWQTVEDKEIVLNTTLTTGGGGLQNLYLNGFIQELEYFFKSVKEGSLEVNNSSENVKTMELCDLITNTFKNN